MVAMEGHPGEKACGPQYLGVAVPPALGRPSELCVGLCVVSPTAAARREFKREVAAQVHGDNVDKCPGTPRVFRSLHVSGPTNMSCRLFTEWSPWRLTSRPPP